MSRRTARAIAPILMLVACGSPEKQPEPHVTSEPPPATEAAEAAARPAPIVVTKPGPPRWAEPTRVELSQSDDPSPDGAPLSLTTSDGTGLALVKLDARAVVEGPLAFTELRVRFRNPENRVLEGRFSITLPQDAAISRLAMKTEGGWQEAEVVERQRARRIYEDFLHQQQDPALLEKEAGNQFRARIFPIPAGGHKDIVLSFSHQLDPDQPTYRLPLRGLPKIAELDVTATVANVIDGALVYEPFSISERNLRPVGDFVAAKPSLLPALGNGTLMMARVEPEFSVAAAPVANMMILFDTSASRALGFDREVDKLGALIADVVSRHGRATRIHVAAFDQTVETVFEGTAGDYGQTHDARLRERKALGASNLEAALQFAAKQSEFSRLVLVTDGIATAGGDDEALRAQLSTMIETVDRLDAIVVGGIADPASLSRLTTGVLRSDGVLIDGSESAAQWLDRLERQTRSGVKVSVKGASWVWPRQVDGLQPGDEILVYADVSGKDVEVLLTGGFEQKTSFSPIQVPAPLLARSAAGARIASLSDDIAKSSDKDQRALLEKQVVELSVNERVLSDYTALLVLESKADYRRYGIEQNALANILTVGERGIEVKSRAELVYAQRTKKPAPDKATSSTAHVGAPPPAPPSESRGLAGGVAGGRVGSTLSGAAAGASMEAKKVSAARDDMGAGDMNRNERARERPSQDAGPMDLSDVDAPNVDAPAEPSASPAEEFRRQMRDGPRPLSGKLAKIDRAIRTKHIDEALALAWGWRTEEPGDILAIVGLGLALEAAENLELAGRVYGSIIDLFPSRADLRRFAASRLQRLEASRRLAVDSLTKAVAQRPDHLSGHHLLAMALARTGDFDAALAAAEAGIARRYPEDRFAGGKQILREDMGLAAAAILATAPDRKHELGQRLRKSGARLETGRSMRFLLTWETDANDVDFHIFDGKGGHAYYSDQELPSGGELYEDITDGYGPECFTIRGYPRASPYRLAIHYYSRGPMGYGMGALEIVKHDGKGNLSFETRPYIVMRDGAYVNLGKVTR